MTFPGASSPNGITLWQSKRPIEIALTFFNAPYIFPVQFFSLHRTEASVINNSIGRITSQQKGGQENRIEKFRD
jgi:hypothetical protein